MKLAPLAALLISAAVAVPAFASGDDAANASNGPKTRAEVKAELAQARADGELSMNPNNPAYPAQFATGGYTVPRVQINTFGDQRRTGRLAQSRRRGELTRCSHAAARVLQTWHTQPDTRRDTHHQARQNTRIRRPLV